MTGERTRREGSSENSSKSGQMHLGERKSTSQRDGPDLLEGLSVGEKSVLIYSCPDPSIPSGTRALRNRTSGPSFQRRSGEGGGWLHVRGWSGCILVAGGHNGQTWVCRDLTLSCIPLNRLCLSGSTYCPVWQQHTDWDKASGRRPQPFTHRSERVIIFAMKRVEAWAHGEWCHRPFAEPKIRRPEHREITLENNGRRQRRKLTRSVFLPHKKRSPPREWIRHGIKPWS